MKTEVLISNLLIEVSARAQTHAQEPGISDVHGVRVATLAANLAYFGYAPSLEILEIFKRMSLEEMTGFWGRTEPALRALTGADRNMGNFVVYKNFPKEVLSMSQGHYWFNQILMYLGAPAKWFKEEVKDRPLLEERLKLKVLSLATPDALQTIYGSLVALKARWTDEQQKHAKYLARELAVGDLDLSTFGFKENGIDLMASCLDMDGSLTIADATDVLRLSAAMSKQDISLREKIVFRKFSREERRFLLAMLEGSKNLGADMAMRPALWKKLMGGLHPGDFKFPKVSAAYDGLYKGQLKTFNAEIEAKLSQGDIEALTKLTGRPGEFARRLHKLCAVYGQQTAEAFARVAPALDTSQLLKLQGYLRTIDGRKHLIFPPKGNWRKAQFAANEKPSIEINVLAGLLDSIGTVLTQRLAQAFPDGVHVDPAVANVKLQASDQELAPYGRGTSFALPKEALFLRTASYWKLPPALGTKWFDNGWSFFDSNWAPVGACCWNASRVGDAAVFSGDPINAKELEGRACQMIDLYPSKLLEQGVRYAVWSVLSFNSIPFEDAEEVLATLQWGEKADEGNLFEPARAQMVFPVQGKSTSKYVAYVDLVTRQVVFMDMNLPGNVQSAAEGLMELGERMPAVQEYLRAQPSVADLFEYAPHGSMHVLYSDAGRAIEPGQRAYVFKPENPENQFEKINLVKVLAGTEAADADAGVQNSDVLLQRERQRAA